MITVRDAGFGIDKVIQLMHEDGRVVIKTFYPVVDMPVLQVCKSCPMGSQLLLCFGIDIKVCFVGRFVIIPVIVREAAILRPDDISVVSAVKPVPSATQGQLGIVFFVLQGEDASEKVIVQPSLADKTGAL